MEVPSRRPVTQSRDMAWCRIYAPLIELCGVTGNMDAAGETIRCSPILPHAGCSVRISVIPDSAPGMSRCSVCASPLSGRGAARWACG